MPLDKKCSTKAMSDNISRLSKEGKPQDQAVAIAYRVLRDACGVPEDAPEMTPKQIVGYKKEWERTPMRGTMDLLERVALPAHVAREIEKGRRKRSLSDIFRGYSKKMAGMKRHRGTPTVVGEMKDKSRLGSEGKAVVKALQRALSGYVYLNGVPKVTAIINPTEKDDGPSVELLFDEELAYQSALMSPLGDHVRDAVEDAWRMSDITPSSSYVRSGRAEEDFEEHLRREIVDEVSDDALKEMKKHLRGTPFSVSHPDDVMLFEGMINMTFKPEMFGFTKHESDYEDVMSPSSVEVEFSLGEPEALEEGRRYEIKKKIRLKGGGEIPAGTKVTEIEFFNDGRGAMLYMPSFRDQPLKVATVRLPKYVKGIKSPSLSKMEQWMDTGRAKSVTGKTVEPDGIASDGSPSWLLVLGMI